MMKKISVLCILADGFEEIEAITVIDLLRRADIQITTAGLDKRWITGSHQIRLECDIELNAVDVNSFSHLFLPGGQPGTNNLKQNQTVLNLIRKFNEMKKGITAICAAPTVLAKAGILDHMRRVTSYPDERHQFNNDSYSEENVVQDGHVITSRGVGTAIEFALYLVEVLKDKKTRLDLAEKILFT
jgi:4-methyl-5(b-hydroxyethyl)-thiazole monophosphate biosynthesis